MTGNLYFHPVIQSTHSRCGSIHGRKSMVTHQAQALRSDRSGQKSFDATAPGGVDVHANRHQQSSSRAKARCRHSAQINGIRRVSRQNDILCGGGGTRHFPGNQPVISGFTNRKDAVITNNLTTGGECGLPLFNQHAKGCVIFSLPGQHQIQRRNLRAEIVRGHRVNGGKIPICCWFAKNIWKEIGNIRTGKHKGRNHDATCL